MVFKFDPYEPLMINPGNRILIVFHASEACFWFHLYGCTKNTIVHDNYSGRCEPFSCCHILTQNINSGFFVNFISIYYICFTGRKNGLAQICSLQLCRKIVKEEV